MATVCYGCGLTTDDDGRLTLDSPLHNKVVNLGGSGDNIDITEGCSVFEMESSSYENTSSCDQRVTFWYEINLTVNSVRPCGNPIAHFQRSEDGGASWVTLGSAPPLRALGYPSGTGGMRFTSPPFVENFTLEPGESLDYQYRICFNNWLVDCTECVDCENPDEEPEDLNTQPTVSYNYRITMLTYP